MDDQGNVDRVVIVIKDGENIPLERFIFAVQNTVQIEPHTKDSKYFSVHLYASSESTYLVFSVENAMSAEAFGRHLRSFLVKLSTIEAQLEPVHLGGWHANAFLTN